MLWIQWMLKHWIWTRFEGFIVESLTSSLARKKTKNIFLKCTSCIQLDLKSHCKWNIVECKVTCIAKIWSDLKWFGGSQLLHTSLCIGYIHCIETMGDGPVQIVGEKLDRNNFQVWKFWMKSFLKGKGLWCLVSDEEPEPLLPQHASNAQVQAHKQWVERSSKVLHYFSICVTHALLIHI